MNTSAPSHAQTRRGMLLMTLGMASFIVNDSLVKYLSASVPVPQTIFLRGLLCSVMLLLVAGATGHLGAQPPGSPSAWRAMTQRVVLVRGILDAFGALAYVGALSQIPLGNASAINMAAPLFITVWAALVWRQHVGLLRGVATCVGFVGVLLVVQPAAAGFNRWALLALLATLVQTARDLTTPSIDSRTSTLLVTVSTCALVTLVAGLLCLARPWQPLTGTQLGLMAITSAFLGVGYGLSFAALRVGEISAVAPFRYSALLFALLSGWLVWRDLPNTLAWVGIALLITSGLVIARARRG